MARWGMGLGLVAVCLLARGASATTVTAMDVETLVRESSVIVRGEVESLATGLDDGGTLQTWVTVAVEESLKGAPGRSRVVIRVPGGRWGGRVSIVYGVPSFRVGERVLLFATPAKRQGLTLTGLFQGKYEIEGIGDAMDAVPSGSNGARLLGPSREPRSRQRLARLRERLRELALRHPARESQMAAASEEAAPVDALAVTETAFSLLPLIPFRWFEPDTGAPVPIKFNGLGSPIPTVAARSAFTSVLGHWTGVDGASLVLSDGGNTTETCRVLFRPGSVISHGDTCAQNPPFNPATCSGVLAATGVTAFTLSTKTVNGTSFLQMTGSDIVFNPGTECFFAGSAPNYEEVLGHEVGHLFGLGHACGDDFTPECAVGSEADDALMRAFAHGGERGGAPHTGDIDGVRFVYPPEGFVDLQLGQTTVSAGDTLSLRADFNGTATSDLYVLLILPDGTFVSLAPGFPVGAIAPGATGVPLSFQRDVTLFASTLTGTEPTGTWTWISFLTRAGTSPFDVANWIGFDYASFTVAP